VNVSSQKSDSIPLTTSQSLIFTGQQLQPNEPLYNMVMVFRITGKIETDLFQRAFTTLIANCDAMRTIFTNLNGQPKQYVLGSLDYQLPHLDFSDQQDPFLVYKKWQETRKKFNFDLAKCVFDSALIKLSDNDFIWYFNKHHLITDAWSTGIIYNYVQSCYGLARENKIADAQPLPSFIQYALYETDKQNTKQFARAKAYWAAKLDQPIVPSKFYRPVPTKKSAVTLRHKCELGIARSDKFRRLINDHRFAAFSADLGLMQLFSTILFTYLHRISGNERLTIGTPNHSRTTAVLKQTAGLLINIFPLQIELAEDESFESLYKKIAQSNQELLINAIPGANQAKYNHGFDVVLNYIPSSFAEFDGLPMQSDWVHPDSGDRNHLLRLQVQNFDQNQAITLLLDLNVDVFQGDEPALVKEHFLILLDAFLADPSQLIKAPSLLKNIQAQPVNQFSHIVDAGKFQTGESVLESFRSTVQANEQKIALAMGEINITFAELHKRSDMVAQYLIINKMLDSKPIAVFMDRSILSVVTILGIIKAGATFLPIDVRYPWSRIEYILSDAQVKHLVTVEAHRKILQGIPQSTLYMDSQWPEITESDSAELSPKVAVNNIAYIIYTSGSTGQPKGVEVKHSGLANYLSWAKHYYLQGKVLDFPLFSSLSFDLTITSLFLPLISAGKLVIYPEPIDATDMTIRSVIEDNRVDIIKLTPAHLTLIQAMDFSTSKLKKLIVGGDDFKTDLALAMDKYFAGNIEIYNEYGPTEATVACTVHRFNPLTNRTASVPIGMPIDQAKIYLLDSHLHAVPQGVVGEIYIAGAGLAKGYLNKPELTAERFITHPENDSLRLYKTGDLATYNEAGMLEYLGRNDHQVKVRGVRIETGEIEAALLNLPNIKNVIVDMAGRFGIKGEQNDQELAVEKCRDCGLAANHPSAQLDAEKVCRICRIYHKQSKQAQAYYQDLPALQAWIDRIKGRSKGKQDSIMLLSGGKDSSYTLCKLVDMGLTPVVFTLDNGYISDGAKANIKRLVERLNLELIIGETEAMDDIFVDSLTRFSNVCNGCFKTIYTMSMKLAKERGISVICTGLSRGQIFETRVAHLFQQGCFSADKIDERVIEARKAYHRADDIISRRLDVSVFQDDAVFEQIQYLDYFRYTDVTLNEMYDYLNNIAPWIRPSDTGRSTNCLINDAGIYVHKKERGYHNYALPYSWDVRLGHKERDAALDELDDEIDQQKVDDILSRVGYQYQKATTLANREEVLVAYYAGPAEIQKNILQKHLAETLPNEYIPSQFIWLNELPLSTNGKVDRQALPKPQQSLRELAVNYIAPISEVETTLAKLWQQLLGVKEVGLADNFFDLGGDSIVNIQIVAAARESGIHISPQQIFDYPTIQELAAVAGIAKTFEASQETVTGPVSLLPIQQGFFATNPSNVSEFVQSVTLQYKVDFTTAIFQQAFNALLSQHDGLRSRFTQTAEGWKQEILADSIAKIEEIQHATGDDIECVIAHQRTLLIKNLDIGNSHLVAACNIISAENQTNHLVIVIHHLVIDGVSWWIFLEGLAKCCEQISLQQRINLPEKSCSVQQWAEVLKQYIEVENTQQAFNYWTTDNSHLPDKTSITLGKVAAIASIKLDSKNSNLLCHEVPSAFNVQVPDVLLAALVYCKHWFVSRSISATNDSLLIDVEGHGREELVKGVEVMRTVAWLTSIYPLTLTTSTTELGDILKATKEQIRKVPNRGIEYGLLRYLSLESKVSNALEIQPQANILFNYMGQWQRTLAADSPFTFAQPISAHHCENTINSYALEINSMIFDGRLQVDLTYDTSLISQLEINEFASMYQQALEASIAFCINKQNSSYTPSDFGTSDISQDDLEDLLADFGEE
jgi:amino acid adenylation domain-containing protein/non-ribosomal peptide synthase protein (TIGR01720 family)